MRERDAVRRGQRGGFTVGEFFMAHAFLWIESLVAGSLIVSTLVGAIAKASSRLWQPRLWQLLIGPLLVILALAVPVGVTASAGALKFSERIPGVPFWPMVVWTSLFIMGTSVLLVRGLRIRSEDQQPCAMSWPLGRLLACSLVAAALTCLTYNSLENDVRIRMMQLRLEAGAKALAMTPPRILDRDNAATIYQEAGATSGQFAKGRAWEEIWFNDLRKLDLTDKKLIDFINSSQSVLRLLRRGASMPVARFDWDSSDPKQLLPEVQFLREGAEVLILDAMLRIHQGDSAATAADLSAVFAISNQLDGPFLIVVLVAMAIEARGIEALEAALANAKGAQEDLVKLKLAHHSTYRMRLLRSLRLESQTVAPALFADIALAGYDLDRTWSLKSNSIFSAPAFQSFWRVFLLEDDLTSSVRRWERMRALAAQPYCEVREAWEKFHLDDGEELGILTRILADLFRGLARRNAALLATSADARHDLAVTGLAAKRYQIATGSFPEKLENLVPEYVDHVPADPFGAGPIQMRCDGNDLVLYSVGADCEDNSGAPWDDAKMRGDLVFRVHGGRTGHEGHGAQRQPLRGGDQRLAPAESHDQNR